MSTTPRSKNPPPAPPRDRATRITLLLLLLVGVGVIVLALALSLPGSPLFIGGEGQVYILGNFLLICFALCPLILCLFPLYLLLMLSIFGVNRLHGKTAHGMERARAAAHDLAERAADATEAVSRRSIALNARLTFFTRLINLFDRSTGSDSNRGKGSDESE
jgi:hypothetical protein